MYGGKQDGLDLEGFDINFFSNIKSQATNTISKNQHFCQLKTLTAALKIR